MQGFFLMDRAMLSHPVVGIANPARFAAWCWMIAQARWKPGQVEIGGEVVQIERGQFVTTIRKMAAETGLSVKETRTFLAHLEAAGMIEKRGTASGTARGTGGGTGATMLTVCNYDKFQDVGEYRAQAGAQLRAQQGALIRKPDLESLNKNRACGALPVDKSAAGGDGAPLPGAALVPVGSWLASRWQQWGREWGVRIEEVAEVVETAQGQAYVLPEGTPGTAGFEDARALGWIRKGAGA